MTSGRLQWRSLSDAVKVIAALEIIGGIVGAGFSIWFLLATSFYLSALIVLPLVVAIDILSIVAGVELWRGHPFGRTASIVIQSIQLPKIISPAVIFMFSFGFDAWVSVLLGDDFVRFGIDTKFLVSNRLSFYEPSAPLVFGVSITAWVYIIMLLKYGPRRQVVPQPPPISEHT